jgi:hypothetical protein
MCLPGALSNFLHFQWIAWSLFLPLGLLECQLAADMIYSVQLRRADKIWARVPHAETRNNVHIKMFPETCNIFNYIWTCSKCSPWDLMHASTRLITDRPNPFRNDGILTDSLHTHPQCDGEMPLYCQQELHTQGILGVSRGKSSEHSNMADVESMQWVLHYLSIGHDRCYWEHLAWHK